ncbi:hypothetical protein [Parabacteroides sp.]|uniref:hypothetical protein n=1 Tax=Parabacteroides sp. TaxID=1869337 RepID=UPI0026DF3C6E|nr:hypothetical protein [Parabacteroides sp.]MDO5430874.1 hypothetical protein [Parabacteroides sp.]
MDIILGIIAVILAIWLFFFVLNLVFSSIGALLAILCEQLIPLLIFAGIGYGIEYACKSWLGFSSLFGIDLFFYPVILYGVYFILSNFWKLLGVVGDIFKDSLDMSDTFKSSSRKRRRSSTRTRYNSSSGSYAYQDGDSLTDSDGNVYHKDGDNKWRDFKGHCIDDNDLRN